MQVGRHGYVKQVVGSGGAWETYDYWDSLLGAGTKKTGTIMYRYRPFLNAPATVGFNAGLACSTPDHTQAWAR